MYVVLFQFSDSRTPWWKQRSQRPLPQRQASFPQRPFGDSATAAQAPEGVISKFALRIDRGEEIEQLSATGRAFGAGFDRMFQAPSGSGNMGNFRSFDDYGFPIVVPDRRGGRGFAGKNYDNDFPTLNDQGAMSKVSNLNRGANANFGFRQPDNVPATGAGNRDQGTTRNAPDSYGFHQPSTSRQDSSLPPPDPCPSDSFDRLLRESVPHVSPRAAPERQMSAKIEGVVSRSLMSDRSSCSSIDGGARAAPVEGYVSLEALSRGGQRLDERNVSGDRKAEQRRMHGLYGWKPRLEAERLISTSSDPPVRSREMSQHGPLTSAASDLESGVSVFPNQPQLASWTSDVHKQRPPGLTRSAFQPSLGLQTDQLPSGAVTSLSKIAMPVSPPGLRKTSREQRSVYNLLSPGANSPRPLISPMLSPAVPLFPRPSAPKPYASAPSPPRVPTAANDPHVRPLSSRFSTKHLPTHSTSDQSPQGSPNDECGIPSDPDVSRDADETLVSPQAMKKRGLGGCVCGKPKTSSASLPPGFSSFSQAPGAASSSGLSGKPGFSGGFSGNSQPQIPFVAPQSISLPAQRLPGGGISGNSVSERGESERRPGVAVSSQVQGAVARIPPPVPLVRGVGRGRGKPKKT